MSKIALKKYIEEQLQFNIESYLDDIIHDFAFNTKDILKIESTVLAKQKTTIKKDFFDLKVKTIITVLGVAASKKFAERILNNLPSFERKEPLIIELAKAISRELQRIELKKKEYISSLSITTSTSLSLKRLETIYKINPDYELGIKLRQNILIAREITRYSSFNFAYILKMCELFMLEDVKDIINDKKKRKIMIIIKGNLNNISTLKAFEKHMKEFCPSWYEIEITN